MKTLKSIICFTICTFLSINFVNGQADWSNLANNPNINTTVFDIEMFNGKVFQIYSQNNAGTDQLVIDMYNPITMQWSNVDTYDTPIFTKVVSERINNTIYIAGYNNTAFKFFAINDFNPILTVHSSDYNEVNVNLNWEFHASLNPNELYVLYSTGTGPSDVHGLEYNSGAGSWTHYSENSSQDLSLAQFQLTSTTNRVFLGYAGNSLRMTFFNKGSISTSMTAYDGSVDGYLYNDGNIWDNKGFLLLGNKSDYKSIYATEDGVNKSFDVEIQEGTTIDINTSAASTTFNLDEQNSNKDGIGNNVYIFSNFSNDGIGNPNDRTLVIAKDVVQASAWTQIGSLIEPNGTAFDPHSFKMSVNEDNKHVAVAYKIEVDLTSKIKILNTTPSLINGTDIANVGICPNQINELYSQIEISDADFDKVSIVSAVSSQGNTTNISYIFLGFYNGISKYKIIGTPNNNTDQIYITVSDGYNVTGFNLGSYTANTTPLNIQFTANPIKICENEQHIDLTQYVNYYDHGIFRVNGQNLNGSEIYNPSFSSLPQTGIIRYIQNVNGCLVSAQSTYQIVQAPSASITPTNTTCSENNGSAVATVTQGSSSNYSYYWSTGESTLTISNLSPGPYYFNVIDDNNCKATALASILSNDIQLTYTKTNPTCYYSNDGSVIVNVTGSNNYQIVWSNGVIGNAINNVSAGNYECTLYDVSGCQIQKTYNLNPPTPVAFNFNTSEPNCTLSNGSINASLSGGNTPYQSTIWNTGQNTTTISNLNSGLYKLTVIDNNGCSYSDSLALNNLNSINVEDSVIFTDCNMSNGGINLEVEETILSGSINSYTWSDGSTTQDLFGLTPGTYSVVINYGNNCEYFGSYKISYKPPRRTDICVVTVHEESTTNLIVWEKDLDNDIQYYNIYRENTVAGVFQFVDTVHFYNLSVFNDVIASPLQRSWRYRISGVNSCMIESALSPIHKTLHLNTIEQVQPGTFKVYWDDYEGINSGTYIIHRYTDQNGWETLSTTVPFGNPTVITDISPAGSTNVDYYVSFSLQAPCSATFKAESFELSRSNKKRGIFNPGEGAGTYSSNAGLENIANSNDIKIYPNPFENEIIFEVNSDLPLMFQISDINGKIIENGSVSNGITKLETHKLKNGLYFISTEINSVKTIYKLNKF